MFVCIADRLFDPPADLIPVSSKFSFIMSRYSWPTPITGSIGDLVSEDLRSITIFGQAILDAQDMAIHPTLGFMSMGLPGRTFPDREWHCFLCPKSYPVGPYSPYQLTDHVASSHRHEQRLFEEVKPDQLTKCALCGELSSSDFFRVLCSIPMLEDNLTNFFLMFLFRLPQRIPVGLHVPQPGIPS